MQVVVEDLIILLLVEQGVLVVVEQVVDHLEIALQLVQLTLVEVAVEVTKIMVQLVDQVS
jgi:hypothetical protein